MAGELDELVNSGKVSLTNNTDAETYSQLRRVRVSIVSNVTKTQLINNTWDKQFDLRDFYIDAQIWLTEPEVATWVGWTVQTLSLPDAHSFQVAYETDQGAMTTLSGTFRLASLIYNSDEEGFVVYDVRLESIDGSVMVT